MQPILLSPSESLRALGAGTITALILTGLLLLQTHLGISPFPKPVGLAFADALFGRTFPLPVGLLFHIVYVVFWSYIFVSLFRNRLTLLNAVWLGLFLAVVSLIVFFPFVGWGLLGLAISPKLIVASVVIHLLFALFLWLSVRWLFGHVASVPPAQVAEVQPEI